MYIQKVTKEVYVYNDKEFLTLKGIERAILVDLVRGLGLGSYAETVLIKSREEGSLTKILKEILKAAESIKSIGDVFEDEDDIVDEDEEASHVPDPLLDYYSFSRCVRCPDDDINNLLHRLVESKATMNISGETMAYRDNATGLIIICCEQGIVQTSDEQVRNGWAFSRSNFNK